MRTILFKALVPCALLCASQASIAQALVYADCLVHDVPSVEAAISSLYDSLEGGPRPAIYLDEWLWNGEFDATHRIILAYQDYAALEAFRARIASDPAAAMMAGNSFENAAECRTDGLSVFRGAWGNQQIQPAFWQVYGVSTSDGAGYAAALAELSEAQGDDAPVVTLLFENRAGISGDTHLVALGAETLAGLNEYMDELFASDDFADFVSEVGATRRLTWRAQAFRMRTWTPDGN
jgi:hypothetical protein